MAVRIRVTGHRLTYPQGVKDRVRAKARQAMPAFAQHLATTVGEAVYETIAGGEWHKSRDPEYGAYRAWVLSHGRGRKRQSLRLKEPDIEFLKAGADPAAMVERLKFNFLVRALERSSRVEGTGLLITDPKRASRRRSALVEGTYEVSKALERVREITAAFNRSYYGGDKARAQREYQRAIQSFLEGQYDYNRFFRETRLGVRLMQRAERAAQRLSSDTRALSATHSGTDLRLKDERVRQVKRAQEMYTSSVKLIHGHDLSSFRRRGRLPVTHAPWGYQSGTLARSWQSAKAVVLDEQGRTRVVITPSGTPQRDRPAPLQLTAYLKRNIMRQRGDPRLLKGKAPRQAVREALQRAQREWLAMGLRLQRGGKGGL